jgi:flagellar export protein FliJ
MGRFVFKLEAVLEQAEVQRTMQRLRSEIASAERAQRDASVVQRGEVNARMLAAQARFAATMRRKIAILREQLAAAQKNEMAAHAALIDAAKGRKVMEKLREKQQAKWMEQEQKREQSAAEDAARGMNDEARAERVGS